MSLLAVALKGRMVCGVIIHHLQWNHDRLEFQSENPYPLERGPNHGWFIFPDAGSSSTYALFYADHPNSVNSEGASRSEDRLRGILFRVQPANQKLHAEIIVSFFILLTYSF